MQRLDYWEEPAESDYDLIIKDGSNAEEAANIILEEYNKKMIDYKIVITEWKSAWLFFLLDCQEQAKPALLEQ